MRFAPAGGCQDGVEFIPCGQLQLGIQHPALAVRGEPEIRAPDRVDDQLRSPGPGQGQMGQMRFLAEFCGHIDQVEIEFGLGGVLRFAQICIVEEPAEIGQVTVAEDGEHAVGVIEDLALERGRANIVLSGEFAAADHVIAVVEPNPAVRHVERRDMRDAVGLERRVGVENAFPGLPVAHDHARAADQALAALLQLQKILPGEDLAGRIERQDRVERREVDRSRRRERHPGVVRAHGVGAVLVADELENAGRVEGDPAAAGTCQASRQRLHCDAAGNEVEFRVAFRLQHEVAGDRLAAADQVVCLRAHAELQAQFLAPQSERAEHLEQRIVEAHRERLVVPAVGRGPLAPEPDRFEFGFVLEQHPGRFQCGKFEVGIRKIDHERPLALGRQQQTAAVAGRSRPQSEPEIDRPLRVLDVEMQRAGEVRTRETAVLERRVQALHGHGGLLGSGFPFGLGVLKREVVDAQDGIRRGLPEFSGRGPHEFGGNRPVRELEFHRFGGLREVERRAQPFRVDPGHMQFAHLAAFDGHVFESESARSGLENSGLRPHFQVRQQEFAIRERQRHPRGTLHLDTGVPRPDGHDPQVGSQDRQGHRHEDQNDRRGHRPEGDAEEARQPRGGSDGVLFWHNRGCYRIEYE